MKPVSEGCQDFETLVKEECFYVDKTRFLSEWWKRQDTDA